MRLLLLVLLLYVPACLAAPESLVEHEEPKRCDWGEDTVIRQPPGMSALVLGGTGAVGGLASPAAAVHS
jgi:hypothetical protein